MAYDFQINFLNQLQTGPADICTCLASCKWLRATVHSNHPDPLCQLHSFCASASCTVITRWTQWQLDKFTVLLSWLHYGIHTSEQKRLKFQLKTYQLATEDISDLNQRYAYNVFLSTQCGLLLQIANNGHSTEINVNFLTLYHWCNNKWQHMGESQTVTVDI